MSFLNCYVFALLHRKYTEFLGTRCRLGWLKLMRWNVYRLIAVDVACIICAKCVELSYNDLKEKFTNIHFCTPTYIYNSGATLTKC